MLPCRCAHLALIPHKHLLGRSLCVMQQPKRVIPRVSVRVKEPLIEPQLDYNGAHDVNMHPLADVEEALYDGNEPLAIGIVVRKHYLVVTTDFVGLFEVGVAGTECLDKGFVVDVRNFSRPKVVWPRLASGVASIRGVFYARFVPFQEQGISLLC